MDEGWKGVGDGGRGVDQRGAVCISVIYWVLEPKEEVAYAS